MNGKERASQRSRNPATQRWMLSICRFAGTSRDMAHPTLSQLVAFSDLRSRSLAIVSEDCIVIRDSAKQSSTIFALSDFSGMKRITTTYPALVVISCGLLLISAAAFCSKEGGGVWFPPALLGVLFAIGYGLTRKSVVMFMAGSAPLATVSGSPSKVGNLITAVHLAQIWEQPPIELTAPAFEQI